MQVTPQTQIVPEEEKKYAPAPEETVAGQMGGILDSGSPYLTAARARGKDFANKRGLLNTSMAAGATEAEAIKAALPIAQQDASYMQNRGLATQGKDIQTELYKTQGEISGGLLSQEGEQAKDLSRLGHEQQTELTTQQGGIQTGLTELEAKRRAELSAQESTQSEELEGIKQTGANYRLELENERIRFETEVKREIANWELSTQERTSLAASMSDMSRQFGSSLATIQSSENLSQKGKTEAVAQLQAAYEADLTSLSNIYGVELSWEEIPMASGQELAQTNEPNKPNAVSEYIKKAQAQAQAQNEYLLEAQRKAIEAVYNKLKL